MMLMMMMIIKVRDEERENLQEARCVYLDNLGRNMGERDGVSEREKKKC